MTSPFQASMHTEVEAKTKWCPFARIVPGRLVGGMMDAVPPYVPPHNRVQECGQGEATTHSAMNCLSSQCMAWRRAETAEFAKRADAVFQRTGKRLVPDTGYCGLAGAVTS